MTGSVGENMATLEGKTLFITGGSRGIGLEIGLRAARDGANVVIAAKTADPHPTLPGTIHSAAEEISDAGGKALAVQMDIRDEAQVQGAVDAAVDSFGGVDILINNASAISLSQVANTEMKRYDLMMDCNARGAFLASKLCIPHLLKADNPHILTLSPPLNMNPKWFGAHCAYTMSKYAMSMTVLGLAEEYRRQGIAVNALWPRTVILTSALNNTPGVDKKHVRRPEIMADAAHVILTGSSRSATGQFYVDEDVLRRAGETDFDQYSLAPGEALLSDLFLD